MLKLPPLSSRSLRRNNCSRIRIQYIRELLDTKVLEALVWLDTRDMVADGLTKGSVDHDALHACMNGIWLLLHSAQPWSMSKKHSPRHHLPDIV